MEIDGLRYRFHWRVRRASGYVLQWCEMTGSRIDVRARATSLVALAADGLIRVMSMNRDASAGRAVIATEADVLEWDPRHRLPGSTSKGWSEITSRRLARVRHFRRLQGTLRALEEEGLLEIEQATEIARAISLALDDTGPFKSRRALF